MSSTITLRASARYGYGGKQYIAQISGRAPKVTFARQFVGQRFGKRNDESEYETDEVGLYELCDVDRKGNKEQRYRVIVPAPKAAQHDAVAADADAEERFDEADALRASDDAGLVERRVTRSEAMAIAKRLARESLDEFVVATDDGVEVLSAARAKKAAAAQTVESATQAAWEAIQALPLKEQRKVLKALRERTTPPKPPKAELKRRTTVGAEPGALSYAYRLITGEDLAADREVLVVSPSIVAYLREHMPGHHVPEQGALSRETYEQAVTLISCGGPAYPVLRGEVQS